MFDALRKLFRKKDSSTNKKTPNPHINQSDEIRKYAKTRFVIPARKKGEGRVSFTARDIHQGLDLASRYPMVCSAIDSKKFADFARVELIKRDGPQQGATAHWTYKVL
jgi:hypothetical protein